jgi:hypothetical protein
MACRWVLGLIMLGMLLPASPALASPACRFQLGFAVLQQLLPIRVGQCLDDASYGPSGDAVQHTTNGLLVWRKSDNWTAFTDGYRTWVAGPNGLQERLNSQRFRWEANAAGLPVVDTPATPSLPPALALSAPATIRIVPADSVSGAGLTVKADPTLISVGGAAGVLAWVRNDAATPLNAQLVAMLTTSGGGLVGQAKATLHDLQPGETRLVELPSIAGASAVTGLRFQFTAVSAGRTTPTLLKLGAAQVDPSDANYALVTLTNTDTTAHSGFVSIAVTNASGTVAGIAYGSYSHLNPSLTTTVRCISLLDPIPPGAHLTAQIDTAL